MDSSYFSCTRMKFDLTDALPRNVTFQASFARNTQQRKQNTPRVRGGNRRSYLDKSPDIIRSKCKPSICNNKAHAPNDGRLQRTLASGEHFAR